MSIRRKNITYHGGPFDGQSHKASRLYAKITRHVMDKNGAITFYDYEKGDGCDYYLVNAYVKETTKKEA